LNKTLDPAIFEWKSFATNQKYTLVEKCLRVSKLLEYPELDITKYMNKIEQIGHALEKNLATHHSKNPTYLISMLNEYLFQNLGYTGDEIDYFNPKNNFLNDVIDKKSGIPVTLSIIYTELAKYIGLDLKIVGFPGHILVKYNEEFILDPFNNGRLLDIDELQDMLDTNFDGQIEFSPEFLDETTPKKILIRLVRNLKNSYTQSYAYKKALKCTNMILTLETEAIDEIRDKGILKERLGDYDSSLKYLNWYLEMNPNGEDVDFVLELIKSIRTRKRSINDR
jgi:regulator of sirC expression with transglutaminase-like and TPR domain